MYIASDDVGHYWQIVDPIKEWEPNTRKNDNEIHVSNLRGRWRKKERRESGRERRWQRQKKGVRGRENKKEGRSEQKKTANIVQAFLIRCNVSVLSNANLIRWKCQKRWRQIRRIVLKSKWHTFNWKIEFGAVVKWNNDKKKIIKNYWKHDRYVILYGN